MNHRFSFVLRMLVASLVLCGVVHAESVTIRLLAFRRVGDVREVMVAGADGKPLNEKPLALPTEQFSPAITVGSRSLVFLKPGAATAAGDAAATSVATDAKVGTSANPALLGKVDLPATGNEFILVFLPEVTNAAHPYRVDAVAIPAKSFGSGDQAFVNYSGSPIGFVIDGEKVQVPHGKATFYHPRKAEGNCTIVGYSQKKDGQWDSAPFYSSRMILQKGVRNLILIMRDPKTGEPDFRGVADLLDAP